MQLFYLNACLVPNEYIFQITKGMKPHDKSHQHREDFHNPYLKKLLVQLFDKLYQNKEHIFHLPDSFLFEEHEMDEIIKTAFVCSEVQKVVSDIRERASISITKIKESEVEANESESSEIR